LRTIMYLPPPSCICNTMLVHFQGSSSIDVEPSRSPTIPQKRH
jgi:hypothetical protein